jgi:hypothetical protein
VVHARAVVEWISEPGVALANMVASLRPGGVILVEDVDIYLGALASPDSPARAKVIDGTSDPKHGPRSSGGETSTDFQRLTLEQLAPVMVSSQLLTGGGEVNEATRELADPSQTFYPPLMVAVWGHRPG